MAIAHDYLTQQGGAERVVLAMATAFPDATIYTTLYQPATTFEEFRQLDIRVSALNRLSIFRRNHRLALPLLPWAVKNLKIDADVLLVSSSGWAHGAATPGRKLVYCHTPPRWIYERADYLGAQPRLMSRIALSVLSPALRRWDRKAAKSADRYLAVSRVVQRRIEDAYGIDAEILHPPSDVNLAAQISVPAGVDGWLAGADFFLCVSRLLPYKHVDSIVKAFEDGSRKLVLVGAGPELGRLKSIASPNVHIVSGLSDAHMHGLYAHCTGLVAASHEDFGLTPLEAARHGKASVLLRRGGYLESMVDGVTCLYFDSPDHRAIADALAKFEEIDWDSTKIMAHAESFGLDRFTAALQSAVKEVCG